LAKTIIQQERAALDRWGKGDPGGYFQIMAPEMTYFDPFTKRRVDGMDALREYMAPITGQIRIDRCDIINPRVQLHSDVAILTFNLEDTGKEPGSDKTITSYWNSTEVYRNFEGRWKIIHSHWSFTSTG
jgi:ketosteroid isomerase-like protein